MWQLSVNGGPIAAAGRIRVHSHPWLSPASRSFTTPVEAPRSYATAGRRGCQSVVSHRPVREEGGAPGSSDAREPGSRSSRIQSRNLVRKGLALHEARPRSGRLRGASPVAVVDILEKYPALLQRTPSSWRGKASDHRPPAPRRVPVFLKSKGLIGSSPEVETRRCSRKRSLAAHRVRLRA